MQCILYLIGFRMGGNSFPNLSVKEIEVVTPVAVLARHSTASRLALPKQYLKRLEKTYKNDQENIKNMTKMLNTLNLESVNLSNNC